MSKKQAMTDEKQKKHSTGEVKSARELALERAAQLEDEPILIQTEEGEKTMTFEEIRDQALRAEDYLRDLQYKQAEFENYRRRVTKEKEDLLNETVSVRDLFEILEHLDRALESEGDADAIKEGVQLIRGQVWTLLEKKGIEKIPAEGEPFDPNFHEALAEQPHETIPKGNVALEYQPGFRIGEKVIRPSKVVVSAGAGN
ncbi:MAG: nucleotide exchange factor GrpE [Candidatus Omnitrophica bacterium]|nr:nucleotide exchange factor GrpE [Candidatus Omnitrophota bacterium]MCB9768092.1 nucleotide exchange factor GrpE [Candidatus Omnitrophota bacterium]